MHSIRPRNINNMKDPLKINGATYHLPENEDDVKALINLAKANKQTICLKGSGHSFPIINILESQAANNKNLYVLLAFMDQVLHIDKVKKTVTVQAGCHLGKDPFDPTERATLQNSLLYQLDQAGLAIPDLGGITHQTVGGFLSTGSSGGSTIYSFEDQLLSVTFINCGKNGPEKVTFSRPVPENLDDPFYGVGVATIGLFGIMIEATFQCVDSFLITGTESIAKAVDIKNLPECKFDPFWKSDSVDDKDIISYKDFLLRTEYTRVFWWPQENIQKMVVWQAKQIPKDQTFLPLIKPYQEVPWIDGSPVPATLAAYLLFSAIGTWPKWLETTMPNSKFFEEIIDLAFYPVILPLICKVFVPIDKNGPQTFTDVWYNGIPMDNQMNDKLMPIWFTELWIDIDKTEQVMDKLLIFFNEKNEHTGSFNFEIYAAKASNFWMSPSYLTDVIRIDILWFSNNLVGPTAFYQQFWDLLQEFNYRPHWAKYLPDGNGPQGFKYLQSVYPRWNDWKKIRYEMDPDQVFVNEYWRKQLGDDFFEKPTN